MSSLGTVRMDRQKLVASARAGMAFAGALEQGMIAMDGDARALQQLLGTPDVFNPMFNILETRGRLEQSAPPFWHAAPSNH